VKSVVAIVCCIVAALVLAFVVLVGVVDRFVLSPK
jgi:hypothetical protein